MGKTKEILADLHVHSIRSGHAYSTLGEIAASVGTSMVAWASTDHFYNCGDRIEKANEVAYFNGLKDAHICDEDDFYSHMICGIEGNLFQCIDLTNEKIDELNTNLRWRLIGVHSWFIGNYVNMDVRDLPVAFEDMFKPEYRGIVPTAFAHIERELERFTFSSNVSIDKQFEDTLAGIVDVAINHDIFLEINNHSLCNNESYERMKFWVRYAADHGAKFCFGTDAHCAYDVGGFVLLEDFLKTVDIGSSYVLNYDEDALINLYE